MNVRLVSVTASIINEAPTPEGLIVYCARVSNPANQTNMLSAPRLLQYCVDKGHWSVFEMAGMCVEVETSRAIAAQILRHRSFAFQEFSQRYSEVSQLGFEKYDARRQDTKNRQNSTDDLPAEVMNWWRGAQEDVNTMALEVYREALALGIAKESARMALPLSVGTRLYMNGTVRSWLHYLTARCAPETQKEHRDIAEAIKVIFAKEFPATSEAVFGAHRDS